MNNKKQNLRKSVGLCTVYRGYNYGSSLQAFALLSVLRHFGYDAHLLGAKGSFVRGRDVRWQKFFWLIFAFFVDQKAFINYIQVHSRSLKKPLSEATRRMFISFESNYLTPLILRKRQLEALALSDDYVAFICGSDQIWKVNSPYLNPMYFLRFAPKSKRIAYAPSFGGSSPLKMHEKRLSTYIDEFDFLSVREDSGKELVFSLTAKSAEVVLDPTLLVDSTTWLNLISQIDIRPPKEFVLLYFLDAPSEDVIQKICDLSDRVNSSFICVRYNFFENQDFVEYFDAGPMEFVSLISKAKFVITDSYHGMLFSINFEIPFTIFSRQYGYSQEQSSRIVNFLTKFDEMGRLDPEDIKIERITVRNTLEIMRDASMLFLRNSLDTMS